MNVHEYLAGGVYCIVCLENGRQYIGSARNIFVRVASHIALLENGRHPVKQLLKDWREFGSARFEFRVLKYCDRKNSYLLHEADAIMSFPDHDLLYNKAGNKNRPDLGIKRRKASKRKKKIIKQKKPCREKLTSVKTRTLGKLTAYALAEESKD